MKTKENFDVPIEFVDKKALERENQFLQDQYSHLFISLSKSQTGYLPDRPEGEDKTQGVSQRLTTNLQTQQREELERDITEEEDKSNFNDVSGNLGLSSHFNHPTDIDIPA